MCKCNGTSPCSCSEVDKGMSVLDEIYKRSLEKTKKERKKRERIRSDPYFSHFDKDGQVVSKVDISSDPVAQERLRERERERFEALPISEQILERQRTFHREHNAYLAELSRITFPSNPRYVPSGLCLLPGSITQ